MAAKNGSLNLAIKLPKLGKEVTCLFGAAVAWDKIEDL